MISDKEDVLEISRHIWDGHDYLPHIFDKIMNDCSSHIFGAEVNGKIMGVANLRLVEEGKIGWMEALRVHPEVRGLGIARKLTERLVDEAKQLGVEKLRYATAFDNDASLKLASNIGMKKVDEFAIRWFNYSDTKDHNIIASQLQQVSGKEFYKCLTGQSKVDTKGHIVYDWKVIDVTLKGLEDLEESVEYWVEKSGEILLSASIGILHYSNHGSAWDFTIYASNRETFLSQMVCHLERMVVHNTAVGSCIVQPEFESILLHEFKFSDIDDTTKMLLLERQL